MANPTDAADDARTGAQEPTAAHPARTAAHPARTAAHPARTAAHPAQAAAHPDRTAAHPDRTAAQAPIHPARTAAQAPIHPDRTAAQEPTAAHPARTAAQEPTAAHPARTAAHPDHVAAQEHHGHSHAHVSAHPGGHHLLQVEGLGISFDMYDPNSASFFGAKRCELSVIHGLSIGVHAHEIVAIVGASGSGKTLLADALMGVFAPNAKVSGRIWFDGVEQDAASLRALRGSQMALVPQSVSHLDPLMRVGRQVIGAGPRTAARLSRMRELFERYGLPRDVASLYPHELSGGMARRVLLCCALMDDPKVLIADEPTPGLDLRLARIALEDFRHFADKGGGVLLITHDIELALTVADRLAVFHDGTVVEETAVANFASPQTLAHPFSRALWHALPEHGFECPACSHEADDLWQRRERLPADKA